MNGNISLTSAAHFCFTRTMSEGPQFSLKLVSYFENTTETLRMFCICNVLQIYSHLLYGAKPDISTGTEFVTHFFGIRIYQIPEYENTDSFFVVGHLFY